MPASNDHRIPRAIPPTRFDTFGVTKREASAVNPLTSPPSQSCFHSEISTSRHRAYRNSVRVSFALLNYTNRDQQRFVRHAHSPTMRKRQRNVARDKRAIVRSIATHDALSDNSLAWKFFPSASRLVASRRIALRRATSRDFIRSVAIYGPRRFRCSHKNCSWRVTVTRAMSRVAR